MAGAAGAPRPRPREMARPVLPWSPGMYRTSEEQVFARVEHIRRRAIFLCQGEGAPPPASEADEGEREALALAAKVQLRLPALLASFGLTRLAGDVLLCLVAAEYDPFLRTLIRAVQRE